jgi:hypothetical protein
MKLVNFCYNKRGCSWKDALLMWILGFFCRGDEGVRFRELSKFLKGCVG